MPNTITRSPYLRDLFVKQNRAAYEQFIVERNQKIATYYNAGYTAKEIAVKPGIHMSTHGVLYTLKKLGVTIRPRGTMGRSTVRKAAKGTGRKRGPYQKRQTPTGAGVKMLASAEAINGPLLYIQGRLDDIEHKVDRILADLRMPDILTAENGARDLGSVDQFLGSPGDLDSRS